MSDKEFLSWLVERLIHVYKENPNVDFIHRLKKLRDAASEHRPECDCLICEYQSV